MIIIKLQNSFIIYTERIKDIGYIDFKLCFKAGLIYESKNKYGITHLLEHMLFRGVGKYDYKSLENLFGNMGVEVCGKTGYDYMSLSFSVMPSKINEILNYFTELFSEPSWTSDDLKMEKEIVKHEIHLKGTDFSERMKQLYDNELLNRSVMGCVSVIDRISLKELKEYHSRVINPRNSMLFISGDFSDNNINIILDCLSNIKNRNMKNLSTQKTLLPFSAFNRKKYYHLIYDYCEYSDLYINFDVKKENQSAARFIQYYLSGYTSPLSEIIVDEKSLSYELYSELDEWKDFSIMIFAISCKYDCLCEVIRTFKDTLNNVINGFSEQKYNEILDFIQLENKKILSNPQSVNEVNFYKYYYGISNEIPTYSQVCEAMKSIFSHQNFSIYSIYSVKRRDVVDEIISLRNILK